MQVNKLTRVTLLIVLVIGIAVAVSYREYLNADVLEDWIRGTGAVAPLLFMVIYALGAVFFLPGSVLTLAGGALFGPVLGTFYNLTGATVGAILAFLVARYLASNWVERKTGGPLKQLKNGVESEGWRFVAFVRLVPLFPFNLLNYALGLTKIRFSHYLIATYICMLPGAVAYTYLGYAGREAVAGGEGLIQKGLLALALVAIAAFLPRLISRLRQVPMISVDEFKKRLETDNDLLVLDVRGTSEYDGEQGHIAGARNIPVEDLLQRLDELNDYRDHAVAIVCRTDKRSSKAAGLLTRKGFSRVCVVQGGMTAWNREGLPVTRAAYVRNFITSGDDYEDFDGSERSPLRHGAEL